MKFVYFPIEVSQRELNGRLLLALNILNPAVSIILVPQWILWANYLNFPRGVVWSKSLNNIHFPNYLGMFKAGFRVIAQDEEFLALKEGFNNSRPWYDLADAVISNNFAEHEFHLESGLSADKAFPLGNLRYAMLSSSFNSVCEHEELDDKAPSAPLRVVINTNFGVLHTKWADTEQVFEISRRAGFTGEYYEKLYSLTLQREESSREVVRDLIMIYRRDPRFHLVLRPHPVECLAKVTGFYGDLLSNVELSPSTPIDVALRRADVVIHTNCTTGLEAAVRGIPCINILPEGLTDKRLITAELGYSAQSVCEIESFLNETPVPPDSDQTVLGRYFPSDPLTETVEFFNTYLATLESQSEAAEIPRVAGSLPEWATQKCSISKETIVNLVQKFTEVESIRRALKVSGVRKIEIKQLGTSTFLLSAT